MTCGVYQLRSPSGGLYIGSSVNIERRWAEHFSTLRSAKHLNSVLLRAWRKHGTLEPTVMLVCREADLLFYEQRCLDAYRPAYNVSKTAGKVDFTPEVLAKMSAWERTPETRALMRAAKLGKKHTLEHRAKVSAARKGVKFTAEHRANMSKVRKGKPVHPNSQAGIEKYWAQLGAKRDISSSVE